MNTSPLDLPRGLGLRALAPRGWLARFRACPGERRPGADAATGPAVQGAAAPDSGGTPARTSAAVAPRQPVLREQGAPPPGPSQGAAELETRLARLRQLRWAADCQQNWR